MDYPSRRDRLVDSSLCAGYGIYRHWIVLRLPILRQVS